MAQKAKHCVELFTRRQLVSATVQRTENTMSEEEPWYVLFFLQHAAIMAGQQAKLLKIANTNLTFFCTPLSYLFGISINLKT